MKVKLNVLFLPLFFLSSPIISSHIIAGEIPNWADPNMKVRAGLELWLDASQLAKNARLLDGGRVKTWEDASGNERNVVQRDQKMQPTLFKKGSLGLVRFDGSNDHFRFAPKPSERKKNELEAFTVIMVVVPRGNLGGYQAFFSANEPRRRDYETGLNIDFGMHPSAGFSFLNVEGGGIKGVRNLRTRTNRFGSLQTIGVATVTSSKTNERQLQVTIDGKPEAIRPIGKDPIHLDEFTVGARYYSNESNEQKTQGFGHFDLAELIIYNRELTNGESEQLNEYIYAKYLPLKKDLPSDEPASGLLLKPVTDPPIAQFFLPGFTNRLIPIDLPNINNIKYRHDDALVALCYDGNIYLLRDTDNDGLEDKAEIFWKNDGKTTAPIGFDLTPKDYKHGNGVFVASKGKISLITDTDKDDKADKEIILAEGWQQLPHGVDALGVAFNAKKNLLYYGMGTAGYTDPYMLFGKDKSGYSLESERGTIMQVDVETKRRKIVATGIRFPVGLRFDHLGSLFCTDQEGATWLANGNPFDELLHIQWDQATSKTRHYGFPPRHPRHLTDVIDEPSTFDYGPQHQSLCGFNFNDPVVKDGPTFGPKAWAHNAIVTGYSRGKLYRTELVRAEHDKQYTARTSLLACLNTLTVDACVSPVGDLVVATHSGGPDWGSGPTGKGKLYKVSYNDPEHPQPVFVWPASKNEVRVEFDRPVDPMLLTDVVKKSKLTAGKWVRAGDRFESLYPGYAVVIREKQTPRYDVPIRSAQLTGDRRTLVLSTDAHDAAVHYALELPGMGRPNFEKAADSVQSGSKTLKHELRQVSAIDLDFDLTGCDVIWKSKDGNTEWQGWLPHLDLNVARAFTKGSATHDALWEAMKQPGRLTLKAQLNLVSMLHPAVQPNAKIDFEYPPERIQVHVLSNNAEIIALSASPKVRKSDALPQLSIISKNEVMVQYPPSVADLMPIEIHLDTENMEPADLSIRFSTNEDDRKRPVMLNRILIPWAVDRLDLNEVPPPTRAPELEGGSWARGRKVFYSEQALCSKCHAIHGQGGSIGPDLSNVSHRDYVSVLRDITSPSFAINPDHLSYTVSLKNGRELSGVLKTENGKSILGDSKGELTELNENDIEEKKPSPQSVMPEGIPKLLGPEKMRDLLTFLLTPAPQMPRDLEAGRPRARTMSEVNAMLKGSANPINYSRKLHVVLVAGPKDHGVGEHDYPAWLKMWAELMTAGENVTVATANVWPEKQEFEKADIMVFYQAGRWDKKRAGDIDAFLARGGGLVYIHYAVNGDPDAQGFAKRIGLAWRGGSKFRHGPLDLVFNEESKHPVARNFNGLALIDESYWDLIGELASKNVIATGLEGGKAKPLFWSQEHGKGRVFVSIPGHYSWSFDDPLFRILLLRGMAWSANESVDRFNELVLPGADVQK